jgi:hypothetical protein
MAKIRCIQRAENCLDVVARSGWFAVAARPRELEEAELVTLDVAHLAAFHPLDLTLPHVARFVDQLTG